MSKSKLKEAKEAIKLKDQITLRKLLLSEKTPNLGVKLYNALPTTEDYDEVAEVIFDKYDFENAYFDSDGRCKSNVKLRKRGK